jgi:hypothetical protein
MSILRLTLAFCLLLLPTVAAADCVHSGKRYAEGSRVGLLVCENSRWVVKR